MRFSTILTLFAASYAAAIPVDAKVGNDKDGKKGGDIATCETKAAAEHVACINGCGKDAACITDCTASAVKEYTACAGV